MSSLVAWIVLAIVFGTVVMFGALGEILTEKGGHLNLGVPGLMFLGGFAGFATAFLLEKGMGITTPFLLIPLPLICGFLVSGLGALLYAFFVTTLRANQNVTGLALTQLGVGIGSFGGVFVLLANGFAGYAKAGETYKIFSANLHSLFNWTDGTFLDYVSEILFSHGFMTYLAIALAILMHFFFKKTRVGLNLRAVGENPATADAAGINVTKYKYLSSFIGGGISGLGGVFYILIFCNGGWSTVNNIEALGWLAVALVIFATWKPLNIIWGSYLFSFLFWASTYLPIVCGLTLSTAVNDLFKMLPYIVTIVVLIITSMQKKKENQPPAGLGLPYFREER